MANTYLDFSASESLQNHLNCGIVANECAGEFVLFAVHGQFGGDVTRDKFISEVWRAMVAYETFKVTLEVWLHDGENVLPGERHFGN